MDNENMQSTMESTPVEAESKLETNSESELESRAAKKPGLFAPERIKKTVILFGALLVVIVAAIITITLCAFSPGNVAERAAKAWFLEDKRAYGNTLAYSLKDDEIGLFMELEDIKDKKVGKDRFYEYYSDKYDEDILSWRDYCKVVTSRKKEYYEIIYGEYKLTVNAKKSKDVRVKKFKSEREWSFNDIFEHTGFDIDNYKKMKCVTVRLVVDGEEEKERESLDVYLVRKGLIWKAVSVDPHF